MKYMHIDTLDVFPQFKLHQVISKVQIYRFKVKYNEIVGKVHIFISK